MNPLTRLAEYLARVERRLRILALARGAAVTAAAALVFTLLVVLVANSLAFSDASVLWGRVILFLAVALALGLGVAIPLVRLNRRRAARAAERKFPEFEERLLTFTERAGQDPRDPFLELLADDTLRVARTAEPARVAERSWIVSFASLAAGALATMIWLTTSGPGFFGYGASLLWGGIPKGELQPYYDIVVEPGSRTVRKRSDQLVTARLVGFQAQRVRVLAKYNSGSKWEEAAMRPQSGSPSFEFLFAGIPESLEYYVEAAGVRSKKYRFNVIELPGVKRIRVTYRYPAWTGMKDAVEDPGGDLRAVQGTIAEVALETDKPLSSGALLLDDGSRLPLRSGDGNWLAASVPIQKDGLYHIAAVEHGEAVRMSEDYFIEARKDEAPSIRISRPGRDAKVNPIEEVTIALEALDDFGLQSMDLHYSVNGGPEKTVALLKSKGAKSANGSMTLYLEDYKLVPGDVVSVYATARDARSSAHTEMFFVETQPFEREYTQSQQAGGGGGGAEGDENRISQRQKEIIAATWNQLRDRSGDKSAAAENARFLSEVQSKLRDQARSLANRMRSRELSGANQSFKSFAEDMEKAVEAMGPAAEKLKGMQWQGALPSEQKALQHLLRAEAMFRQIQVAFGSRGGGGGRGGGLGRDLEGLFDLELDTEKNQYESEQQSASADQRQKEIDAALQKLEQLARRQQELAQQRRNQATPQQRWQQEMLRREAEQLQRQLEQLQRGQQGQQGQQSQQAGQQGQSQGQSQAAAARAMRMRGGQGGGQSQQIEQAIQRLMQAMRDMRQSGGTPQTEAEARRAAERLQEARDMLSGLRREQSGRQLDDLVRQSEQLAERQQEFNNRLRQTFGSPGQQGQQAQPGGPQGATREKSEQMAQEKQQLLDSVERLERQMQQAARDLAATQREASRKVREALGAMQQEELPLRMRWSAEAIRRGLGAYAVMREATTTQALNQLRDQLRDAQQHVKSAQGNGDQQKLEQALAQAESLRQQIEQMARNASRGRAGQQGQQPGQSQGGQPSQGGQGQEGSQAGQGQYGGRYGGQGSGSYSAMNRGDWQPPAGGVSPQAQSPESIERAYRDSLRDLSRLNRSIEGNPELSRDIQDLIREMQRLDPKRFPGNPELVERLRTQVLGEMEQIELRLRRLLDDKQGGNVRSGASEPIPPGYADAIAEYFRRLSRDK